MLHLFFIKNRSRFNTLWNQVFKCKCNTHQQFRFWSH